MVKSLIGHIYVRCYNIGPKSAVVKIKISDHYPCLLNIQIKDGNSKQADNSVVKNNMLGKKVVNIGIQNIDLWQMKTCDNSSNDIYKCMHII
jgi:hypothetical protein